MWVETGGYAESVKSNKEDLLLLTLNYKIELRTEMTQRVRAFAMQA